MKQPPLVLQYSPPPACAHLGVESPPVDLSPQRTWTLASLAKELDDIQQQHPQRPPRPRPPQQQLHQPQAQAKATTALSPLSPLQARAASPRRSFGLTEESEDEEGCSDEAEVSSRWRPKDEDDEDEDEELPWGVKFHSVRNVTLCIGLQSDNEEDDDEHEDVGEEDGKFAVGTISHVQAEREVLSPVVALGVTSPNAVGGTIKLVDAVAAGNEGTSLSNVLRQLEASRRESCGEQMRRQQWELEHELLQVQSAEHSQLETVARQMEEWRSQIQYEEARDRHELEQVWQKKLSELKQRHSYLADVEEQRLQKESQRLMALAEKKRNEAEAALKQQQEAAARLLQAQEEHTLREDAARKAEEKQKQEGHAQPSLEQQQSAPPQQQQQQGPSSAEQGKPTPPLPTKDASSKQVTVNAKECVAPGAAKTEDSLDQMYKECQEMTAAYTNDNASKRERKQIRMQLTQHIQQIAATQQQVARKSQDILNFLAQFSNAPTQKAFAMMRLSDVVISQCEVQVVKLNQFAFPLAEVLVRVGMQFPHMMTVMMAKLQRKCKLCVPMYLPYYKELYPSEEAYLLLQGYKGKKEEDGGGISESADDFFSRLSGYVMLFAAILQCDRPTVNRTSDASSTPDGLPADWGLQYAWKWLARLLNHLPANRYTATALDAFIKVAGWRLHKEYGRQFLKLLKFIVTDYIAELSAQQEPELAATITRLRSYCQHHEFNQVPAGREMPISDESSQIRA